MRRITLALACLVLTTGCEQDNDPGPGGVTVGEARELDEAAKIVEQQRLPDDALPETDGETPQPEITTPAERPARVVELPGPDEGGEAPARE